MRTIYCMKLKKEAKGLEEQPFRGELGERIFASVSQEAWSMWINHQTMLINEYRLSTVDPKAREFLRTEMEKYLFGASSKIPDGYQAE